MPRFSLRQADGSFQSVGKVIHQDEGSRFFGEGAGSLDVDDVDGDVKVLHFWGFQQATKVLVFSFTFHDSQECFYTSKIKGLVCDFQICKAFSPAKHGKKPPENVNKLKFLRTA